ncbi:hypothetical protein [Terrisporobacter mayombei]|uniref:Uncharacterized protein n=1 Tax=Terrisporobacter mayombei TaxID=1541 RepID=A0ABY9PY88_9FIRM|nr:hypothetical protein [Terrisporobacter mayombei]MCC3868519.1 hypothetical protein [Terrisporobacter mayombei]WMT80675.1 hypothetical protein TEMA_09960 [Terrisporobacter mayombei]
MYGKLINGELTYAPKDLIEDEKVILDFDTNIEAMKQHGYKLVVRILPEHNSDTQYLALGGYSEDSTQITINYMVMNKVDDPEKLLRETIKDLQDESKFLKDCLLEMSEVVYGG